MSEELQPQEPETAQEALEQTAQLPESVTFTFETRFDDVLLAARVIDHKARTETRHGIQMLGILLILWMFVPELFKNPAQITNWIMVVLSVGLGLMIWKYPDRNNRKFAAAKVELSPTVTLTLDSSGFTTAGKDGYAIPFENVKSIFGYKDIIAIVYDRNHIMTIPKAQLDEATLSAIKAILGDRCEEVAQFKDQTGQAEKKEPKKLS